MAVICNSCGYAYNSDDAEHCDICNGDLRAGANIHSVQNSRLLSDQRQNGFATLQSGQSGLSASIDEEIQINRQYEPPEPPVPSSHTPENQPDNAGTEQILEGRISHIERNDELPQTDIFRVLAKLLIGILFFIPYVGLFIATGCLSFAFAVIGFRSLSQLFNPVIWSTSIFELLEIIVLRRIRGTDTVPIYRGMVEDTASQEYAFIFRGPMRAGNLIAGHNVRLFGQRERGTFVIQRGIDLTGNSQIISSYRNPWRFVFYFMLVLYIIMGLIFYLNFSEIAAYYDRMMDINSYL